MRILFAITAAALALLLVKVYLTVDEHRAAAAPQAAALENAAGEFRLELELSFDAGPDRFSADLNNSNAVSVRFAGSALYETNQPVAAGEEIEIADIGNIVAGRNEFLIEATPQNPGPPLFAKIAIYSSQRQEPIAERFLWAPAGSAILSGVANFSTADHPPIEGGTR
ncbi:hypothetical protein [Blastopirellula marina]|uniref:Uncharacterized protein n=1 Tax=Blastopirellula marina DSM 3645 TaxID=314230 RepID=A3ZXI8_9BACT|nr:hypothetical protein [Blastopirellula marina]EAQ78778.1 hypothetical protein DSM3645_29791 [Blastopirellula marina DSM 3645]